MSDGSIAGGGYSELRRAKLIAEGVPFTDDGRVDMRACRWNGRAQARADSGRLTAARAGCKNFSSSMRLCKARVIF